MKPNTYLYSVMIVLICLLIESCQTTNTHPPTSTSLAYKVCIEEYTPDVSPPALQSFVHATDNNDWLLFAGRTNPDNSTRNGGLHQIINNEDNKPISSDNTKSTNNDYAYYSFPCESFNSNMYVYNVAKNTLHSIDIVGLIKGLNDYNPSKYHFPFQPFYNTNALARQVGDTLYVAGGYGPSDLNECKTNILPDTVHYSTSPYLMKLYVPFWIDLIKNNKPVRAIIEAIENGKSPILWGQNTHIASTGGELFIIDKTFYVAGGQNYWETDTIKCSNTKDENCENTAFEKLPYLTSVRSFTISPINKFSFNINTLDPITDVLPIDSLGSAYADSTSKFRRRDVAITPTYFQNGSETNEGFVFHGGVFKSNGKNAGSGPFCGWDDALFINPTTSNSGEKWYTSKDPDLYQLHNIYSCATIVGYDDSTKSVHTILMGGIGDGQQDYWLSGFTKSVTYVTQPLDHFADSIHTTFDPSGFDPNGKFYGAGSVFIFNETTKKLTMEDNPELLDLSKLDYPMEVGYIYGGIEADIRAPGGYKGDQSRASNKIFKVCLFKSEPCEP